MCAEATVEIWRSLRMSVLGIYQGASTVMRKAFDRNLSSISMLEGGSSAPELYAVGPDGFENCFIEKFVGTGKLRLTSEQPIYFGEGDA
jgi:hypothetical protein